MVMVLVVWAESSTTAGQYNKGRGSDDNHDS